MIRYLRQSCALAFVILGLSACGATSSDAGGNQPAPIPPAAADSSMEWDDDNWDEKDWQ